MGNRRFDTMQAQTLVSPQLLTTRLKRLEVDGMLERRSYNTPPRYEYHLTAKGEAFTSVLLALRAWGETWCKAPEDDLTVHYIHQACGREVGLGTVCEGCGAPFTPQEVKAEQSEAFDKERAQRTAAANQHAQNKCARKRIAPANGGTISRAGRLV